MPEYDDDDDMKVKLLARNTRGNIGDASLGPFTGEIIVDPKEPSTYFMLEEK